MPCRCTTGRAHIALLPNTFEPHTFLTTLGRTTKSQLWPISHYGGEALPDHEYILIVGSRRYMWAWWSFERCRLFPSTRSIIIVVRTSTFSSRIILGRLLLLLLVIDDNEARPHYLQ